MISTQFVKIFTSAETSSKYLRYIKKKISYDIIDELHFSFQINFKVNYYA